MISCKQASELVLKKGESKISFRQQLQLWFHLGLCSFCRLFKKQNGMIDRVLKSENHLPVLLSESDKKKIAELLEASL